MMSDRLAWELLAQMFYYQKQLNDCSLTELNAKIEQLSQSMETMNKRVATLEASQDPLTYLCWSSNKIGASP